LTGWAESQALTILAYTKQCTAAAPVMSEEEWDERERRIEGTIREEEGENEERREEAEEEEKEKKRPEVRG
jgi:hypothetical protein